MKRKIIALFVAFILLLQVLATPVFAIEEIVEDILEENSQVEVTEEKQEDEVTEETEEIEPEKEEIVVDSEPIEAPILKDPVEEIVSIPDDELREAILSMLVYNGVITDDERETHQITASDMLELDYLEAYYVSDTTGLEYATNLIGLGLPEYYGTSFDLQIVRDMANLENLSISGNSLRSIESIPVLNLLPKLTIVDFKYENQTYIYNNITELKKFNRASDLVLILDEYYEDYDTPLQTVIDELETFKENVKRVIYDPMLRGVVCTIPFEKADATIPISLENISPIFHDYILNTNSVFYRPITGASEDDPDTYWQDDDPNLEVAFNDGEVTLTITTHEDDDYGMYNVRFNLSYYIYYNTPEDSVDVVRQFFPADLPAFPQDHGTG